MLKYYFNLQGSLFVTDVTDSLCVSVGVFSNLRQKTRVQPHVHAVMSLFSSLITRMNSMKSGYSSSRMPFQNGQIFTISCLFSAEMTQLNDFDTDNENSKTPQI